MQIRILGITGTYEGYTSTPLYLFNNGYYGGGQSGLTQVWNATEEINISSTINSNPNYFSKGIYVIRFNNTQDLSNYNYLKIYGYKTGALAFGGGISNKSDLASSTDYATYGSYGYPDNSGAGNGTAIVNISSFYGNYWIYLRIICSVSGINFNISQVYLSTN